jgi:hypothetical protein
MELSHDTGGIETALSAVEALRSIFSGDVAQSRSVDELARSGARKKQLMGEHLPKTAGANVFLYYH